MFSVRLFYDYFLVAYNYKKNEKISLKVVFSVRLFYDYFLVAYNYKKNEKISLKVVFSVRLFYDYFQIPYTFSAFFIISFNNASSSIFFIPAIFLTDSNVFQGIFFPV